MTTMLSPEHSRLLPARYDWNIIRGTSGTQRFRFRDDAGNLIDISGYTWRLSIVFPGGVIRIAGSVLGLGEVGFALTVLQTRSVPIADANYEIEARNTASGDEEVWIRGRALGGGGLNLDGP